MSRRDLHRASTQLLSLVLIGIGIALIARTIAGGGGALAIGIILGVLFMAAGSGRLWVSRRSG